MYSFDVFDTLITRRTADPKGIFMLMQEKIKRSGKYPLFLADNFYELRVGSERLARYHARQEKKQEITLDQIYKALSTTACITADQIEELEKMEIETEYNNVLGVPKNIDFLKQLVGEGEQVVLISDMYLGEKVIRRMLERTDSIFQEIPLYVSSDFGVTKGSGELYHIVRDIEKADYLKWTHYGDNDYADIEMAEQLGIKAVQVTIEKVKEYEQPDWDLYHQLSVGASRYIRDCGIESVAGEIGSSLAGPILYPYVKWVLEQCQLRGINRLYFVARDGWILQQIADRIIQMEQFQIQTHYIYGSRKAWRLPSYNGSIEDFDRIIKWSNMGEIFCLNDFATLFQIEPEKLKDALADEYRWGSGNQKLSMVQKDNICRQLRENAAFREYLVQSQKENRRLVIDYLKQEIDVSDPYFAFVELAGTGFTQKCLAGIMENFYQGEVFNFFFKLDYIQNNTKCRFINFCPSDLRRSYMLELLCRAPHGQTKSYEKKGGRVEPVLEEAEGELTRAYGLEEYKEALLSYVEQIENTFIQNSIRDMVNIHIAITHIGTIAEKPPERIAEYFCHMPFSSGGRRNTVIEFAPPVTRKQLRKIYFWKSVDNYRDIYQGDTLEYALVASPKAKRYSEKCQKYRMSGIGKKLIDLKRYLTGSTTYFCPWELLHGNIVIYGAGKVGQAYVKQAKRKKAKCDSLLWVDKNYRKLQEKGLDVKSPEEIRESPFDRIIVAIHDNSAKQEIGEVLREMKVETGKIYYG